MIVQKGSREMAAKMRKDFEKFKTNLTKTHQNLVKMMFRDLVAHTPQWSGELALHWGIEVHGMTAPSAGAKLSRLYDKSYTDYMQKDVYKMGEDPAVTRTVARELAKVDKIRYNSIVKFVNNLPYAQDVQDGKGPNGRSIREVNMLAAYGGVAMVNYIDMKYNKLGAAKRALKR